MKKVLSIRRLLNSFRNAFNGIIETFKSEPNMKIHVFMALIVVICGFIFKLSNIEWIVIILLIGLILGAEVLNTCIENFADLYSTEYNPKIKIIKDTGAGMVLSLAICSVVIGLIIFIPKLLVLIGV